MTDENFPSLFDPVSPDAPTGEFQRLTDPYRHELLVHCYRFLGSLFDAEDALQETLLRAWRRLDSLREPSSIRAWLYRIATNVCLDLIKKSKPRLMPAALYPPANPQDPLPLPVLDPIWLEPFPDEYLSSQVPGPEARYDTRESVTLAFLAVLQLLPGRQRAVLILRDVLGWKADEVADLLAISVAAANSALQRARATMNKHQSDWTFSLRSRAEDSQIELLLTRYRRAWENADPEGLVTLLREDAILSMPPMPVWYQGRATVAIFYGSLLSSKEGGGRFRMLPTRANGCPAFATYQLAEDEVYRPVSLQLLVIAENQIAHIVTFLVNDSRLFAAFGLPVFL
jgi:RNA polymerase sigma-70 factor (ECF subfamily)